jgi:Protease inhibitor Inh
MAVRAAVGGLIVLALQGCAGEQRSLGSSTASPTDESVLGRWLLATSNAPPCGLELGGTPGTRSGKVAPDGGCPGNFYMSRRWVMEGGTLMIANERNEPLAQFKPAGRQFEGQSTAGTPVILAR